MTVEKPLLPEFDFGLGRKSEAVLQSLRAELDSGALTPGARLPTEIELCRRFKANRSTVRRATARLVAEGRIRVRQGSGAFVCEFDGGRPRSRTISVMFPFDREILRKVQQRILDMGHLLCIYTHDDWDPAKERAFLERVAAERHHALLAFCTPLEPRNDAQLQQLERSGVRVVHVEHYRIEPPAQNFILPDYRRAGYMGATALMIAGYEELHYVGMSTDGPYAQLIHQGFAEAIRDLRGSYDPAKSFIEMSAKPSWEEIASDLYKRTDRTIGVLSRAPELGNPFVRAAKEMGEICPDRVGVVSVGHLLSGNDEILTDEIDVDWMALLERALDEVERPVPRRAQEYVSPTLTRRGTVKSPVAARTA